MAWAIGRGYTGDLVTQIQQLLALHGSYEGRIDGWFGPQTEAALRAWQAALNVVATGKWDPPTNLATTHLMRSSEFAKPNTGPGWLTAPVVPRASAQNWGR